MKILQILPELSAGGVERGTLEIGKYLVEEGHESVVISNGGRLVEPLEREGSRHIQLPVHRKSVFSLRQVPILRQVLERESPDILHARSRVPAWIAWLAWRQLPPSDRPHFVTTVHGFYSVNRYSRIMTRGERVVAVSAAARAYIRRNFPRTPEDRIVVIPRGVPAAGICPGYRPEASWLRGWQQDYPHLEGKRVLLLPGRITRFKGHADFFQLLASLKSRGIPIHGLIAGEAHPKKRAYLQELKTGVAALGLEDDITFTGHREDLRDVMSISDIVFSLSRQPEAFGRTTLEALAIGKPVVAYAHGGVAEQLERIFPAGAVAVSDLPGLVATTLEILSSNLVPGPIPPAFTCEEMCRATLEMYRELSRGRSAFPSMTDGLVLDAAKGGETG